MARIKKKFEETKPDLTPMIDVTFLLLIFFIVTLKFKTLEGRLDSNLPKDMGTQSTKTDPIEKVDLVMSVARAGDLVPDPNTATTSQPKGRLNHYRNRVIRIQIGTQTFLVRSDVLDEHKLLADLADVRQALEPYDRKETPITLDARQDIIYGDIIAVLDLVIDMEFEKVSFSGSQEQG